MKISLLRNNKSFALVLAVLVLLLFSIFGSTVAYLLIRRTDAYLNKMSSLQAFYMAQAARNFFLEYTLPFENNFSNNTLGNNLNESATINRAFGTGSRFTITYTNRMDRSANVSLQGISGNITRNITMNIAEDDTQNQSILASLRRFNAFFGGVGSTDTTIESLCYQYTTCSFMFCLARFGPRFMGKVFVNNSIRIGADMSNVTYGSTAAPEHIYANGSINLTRYYNDNSTLNCGGTTCGVYNNAYASGTITDNPSPTAIHGAQFPSCNCGTNAECCWPTKPTIDSANYIGRTGYYNLQINKAVNASNALTSLAINTTNASDPFRNGLQGRNIYVRGPVTITSSQNFPLRGPGNIIAAGTGGTITIANNSWIGERTGLITQNSISNTATLGNCENTQNSQAVYMGGNWPGAGFVDGNGIVTGMGTLLYAQGLDAATLKVAINGQSRVKAFILVPNSAGTPNVVQLAQCTATNTNSPTKFSQLQGIIYTQRLSSWAGHIFGNVYADSLGNSFGGVPNWLSMMFLFDTLPNTAPTNSDLPLELRGLYKLRITSTIN